MRVFALALLILSSCTEPPTGWLEWPAGYPGGRFEGGSVRQAICEDVTPERVRIRVDVIYDLSPGSIDDEAYVDASFEVDRSILDGEAHAIRGWVDVPTDFERDPDNTAIVFTPDADHDPAIHRAIALPYTQWDSPRTGRFRLTGTLRVEDACPSGSMQVLAEGDTIQSGAAEAFMPFEPQPPP